MSAKTLSKKSELTLEDLAMMVKHGFDDMDQRFEDLETEMRNGFHQVNERTRRLETGIEEVRLRLDNVPYRFELTEVDKRVTKIEKRLRLKVQ